MKYLDVSIDEVNKAELKALLDAHNVEWHEGEVLRFSVTAADALHFIIQCGVVGSVTKIIIQWLKAKQNRRVKISKVVDAESIDIDVTGYSVKELETLLNSVDVRAIAFKDQDSTEQSK